MKFLAALAAAVVVSTGASALQAQTPSGYYVAVPAAPAAKGGLITRSTAWRVQNGALVANQAPERAEILCQLVAKNAGTLESFSAAGKAFDADALAKCNAKAKRTGGGAAAVAAR